MTGTEHTQSIIISLGVCECDKLRFVVDTKYILGKCNLDLEFNMYE